MLRFIVTFGANHVTADGASLGNRFVEIEADSEQTAREIVYAHRGPKWAFIYPNKEIAGVERFGLREIDLGELYLPIRD